ncbi:MAG: hypothetical protein HYT22_02265 [Candidatus Niyogibacteria bacterium]|nr:hypothetical protein [Candidatus Niyogibacteria bacterium]
MEPKRGLLWAGIGALSLSALGAIFIFLFGKFGELEVRLLLTALTIGWYSMCASATFGFHEKDLGFITVIGVVISVVGAFTALHEIWFPSWDFWGDDLRAVFFFLVVSFSIAHSALLLKMQFGSGSRWVSGINITTMVVVWCIAGMLTWLIFSDNWLDFSEFFFRLLASLVVLDLLGTILAPTVKKLTAQTSGGNHA